MSKCSEQITELRKKSNLTQAELGEKLNVSAQAVSKWENGLSEPDIDSIKKLCELFNVSTDELLGLEKEKKEEPIETKVIVAHCEKCHKPVAFGEYKVLSEDKVERSGPRRRVVTEQHTYCNECYVKILKEKKEKEEKERQLKIAEEKEKNRRGLKRGIIFGILGLIAVAITFLVLGLREKWLVDLYTIPGYIVFSVFLCYGIFGLIAQLFWDGFVWDILDFFSKSFKMPGVIFSLDLESIVAMITIKITLAILSFCLSLFIFLIGVLIASFCSIFSFPFALHKQIKSCK